jgi:hypothetical protein
MADIQLVVYGTNLNAMQALEAESNLKETLTFFHGNALDATKSQGLDALLITIMQAERFGISPPFPLNESVVAMTRTDEIAKGIPRFLVAGVRIDANSLRDWGNEVGTFLKAGIRAIRHHNESTSDKIQRVGVLIDNFRPEKAGIPHIAKAIDEALSGSE